jgi:hypothetical protein
VCKLGLAATALTGLCLVTTGCPSFRAHAPDGGGGGAGAADGGNAGAGGDAQVEPAEAGPEAPSDAGDGGPSVDASDGGGQVIPLGPVCSSDGWCWESPLPQGNDLAAVWGSSRDAVWAVGDLGTILYWGGSAWAAAPSGTTKRLNGVWGTSANDAWAVGNSGTIERWNGAKWSTFSSPTTADLRAVWASGPTDAWAVGAQKSILHWNGQWIAQPDPGIFPADLTLVWGAGPDDVWFAGPTGIIRRKGTTFTMVSDLSVTDAGVHITAISGSGADTVIATGADAAGKNIYIYLWSEADQKWGRLYETAGPPVTSLVVRSPSAIWAAGANLILNFDGTNWTSQFSNGIGLAGLWLGSAADGWAVGAAGQMIRYDGMAWAEPSPRHLQTLTDAWWTAPATPAPGTLDGGATDAATDAGGADGATDAAREGGLPDRGGPSVWVSGFDPAAAAHHGGAVWREQDGRWDPVAVGDVAPLWSIWSPDGSAVWAAGEALLRGDTSGAPWTVLGPGPLPFRRVRGLGASSIWSVEATVHFSNRAAPWPQDGSQLWGLAVFSDYDVWASGASGRVFHWITAPTPHWLPQDPPANVHALYALGGVASGDLWAVGDAGVIRHWDGTKWIDSTSGTTQALRGVFARASRDVWAVGDGGTILHWDGTRWSPSASGTTRSLNAVVSDAAGNVWAVGEQSTILHRSP